MSIKSLLKPEVKKWLDKSAESELFAHNLYKYLAAQCQRLGFFGMQKYFLHESEDELKHYNMLVDYTNDMGSVISMPLIPRIADSINTIMDALEVAYETESDLLDQYVKFYKEAEDKYDDCVTATFLIEFLQIQRKSVGEFGDLISRFEKNRSDVFEFDEFVGELVK